MARPGLATWGARATNPRPPPRRSPLCGAGRGDPWRERRLVDLYEKRTRVRRAAQGKARRLGLGCRWDHARRMCQQRLPDWSHGVVVSRGDDRNALTVPRGCEYLAGYRDRSGVLMLAARGAVLLGGRNLARCRRRFRRLGGRAPVRRRPPGSSISGVSASGDKSFTGIVLIAAVFVDKIQREGWSSLNLTILSRRTGPR
jgi:hypothetical protein